MKRSRIAALALVTAALAASAAAPRDAKAEDVRPTITVTGQAEVAAVPDLAMVSAGTLTSARTAAEAVAANAAVMSGAFEALAAIGIAPRDIQTANLRIEPQYVYPSSNGNRTEPPHIVAYQVTNQIAVRVRDVNKVGAVFDALVEAGINQSGGISFTVADPTPLRNQALAAAIADARQQAEIMAEAAGVSLGALLSISPQSHVTPVPYARATMRMEAAADTPIAAGETTTAVQVTLSYEIIGN